MESSYSEIELIRHILNQLSEACQMIEEWNKNIHSADEYPSSMAGMEKMAASCMLIEAIGEGVKKIDRLDSNYLSMRSPAIQWKQIKGLRDHIAHGYFNLDAEIIFDVVKNEIPKLKIELIRLHKES